MTQQNPHEQRPWTGPQPIGYRRPDPARDSQWATDDSAYATCLVYAAIALSIIGALVGGVAWIIWQFGSLFFGG